MAAEGKIPLKARLPWFLIWVPLALLLYILVNGAGHMASTYKIFHVSKESLAPLETVAPFLWGSWAFLTAPTLAVFAWVGWKTCPFWSAPVRWVAGVLSLLLVILLLGVQGWLVQAPYGWPPAKWNWPKQRTILATIWKPHLSRPGLEISAPYIAQLLKDPDEDVRGEAAKALSQLDAKAFAPDIAQLLKDPDESVRSAAAEALKRLGQEAALPE
jgi:hypothetical protein